MLCANTFRRTAARQFPGPVVRASSRAVRLRAAADLIADIVPPPLAVYPRARAVLEAHAAAICSRFDGSGGTGLTAPISDDLVPALRAEAGSGGLAVSAALPLVTAAANLGELELTYPPELAKEGRDRPEGCIVLRLTTIRSVSSRPTELGAASARRAELCRTGPR